MISPKVSDPLGSVAHPLPRNHYPDLVSGDTNDAFDIFVKDRRTGAIERVSVGSGGRPEGNGDSSDPSISADGRFVMFDSIASNLVPGDTNSDRDAFVKDRKTGTIERISKSFE